MKENDIDGLKSIIRSREIMLKGESRSKTAHPGEFDENVWFAGRYLDYRFNNAKNIIRDIFESENPENISKQIYDEAAEEKQKYGGI